MRLLPIAICLGIAVAGPTGLLEARESDLVDRGRFLYGVYCKSCHGAGARGDGPAAAQQSVKPTDLTRLAEANGGEFPFEVTYRAIDGRDRVQGHAVGQMPIWGLRFQQWGQDSNQEDEVRGKILQLIRYLESLQVDD